MGGKKEKRKEEKKKELRRCVQGFSQEAMRIEGEQMPRNWNKNPPQAQENYFYTLELRTTVLGFHHLDGYVLPRKG